MLENSSYFYSFSIFLKLTCVLNQRFIVINFKDFVLNFNFRSLHGF